MTKKKYGELNAGDIIRWHGARERIKEIHIEGESEYYKGEKVIRFDLEPADEEAVQILGRFYSHGTYGGVEHLEVTVE